MVGWPKWRHSLNYCPFRLKHYLLIQTISKNSCMNVLSKASSSSLKLISQPESLTASREVNNGNLQSSPSGGLYTIHVDNSKWLVTPALMSSLVSSLIVSMFLPVRLRTSWHTLFPYDLTRDLRLFSNPLTNFKNRL